MTTNKIITVWERYDENSKQWKHNHISNGYSADITYPVSNSKTQKKSWAGGKWRGLKARLDNIKVVFDV